MPHVKIDHGPTRPQLRVIWGEGAYPDQVFIHSRYPNGSLVEVALDDDDIDTVIAALRKAKRKTSGTVTHWEEVDDRPRPVGTIVCKVKPETQGFKDSLAVQRAAQEIATRGTL